MKANTYRLLAVASILAVSAASCKKDYTCECTVRIYNPYQNTNTTEKITDKFYATEYAAKGKCKDMERQMDSTNYIYVTCVSFK